MMGWNQSCEEWVVTGIWAVKILPEASPLSASDWFGIFSDSHCLKNTMSPITFPKILLFNGSCLNFYELFFKYFEHNSH